MGTRGYISASRKAAICTAPTLLILIFGIATYYTINSSIHHFACSLFSRSIEQLTCFRFFFSHTAVLCAPPGTYTVPGTRYMFCKDIHQLRTYVRTYVLESSCYYCFYLSCHPTMCSTISNFDHSQLSRKKKTSETKNYIIKLPGMMLAVRQHAA